MPVLANIFYLHPTKCGGHSIEKCLNNLEVSYIKTSDLSLELSTIDALEKESNLIVFGHIDYVPRPKNPRQKDIRNRLLESLYFRFNLIMPTRHPSNLLQSWMHYAKTRCNQIFLRPSYLSQASALDLGMISKVASLRQKAVRVDFTKTGKICRINEGAEFPIVTLKEEDEEHNLNMLATYLASGPNSLPQLCSLQYQLFHPFWSSISHNILNKKKVVIDPPVSTLKRSVIYYDCENITTADKLKLDSLICNEFGEMLEVTKENKSLNKNKAKGSDFDSLNQRLRSFAPGEWQIYAKSTQL